MARLDGKYEILRSVPGSSGLPLPEGSLSVQDFSVSEATDPQGGPVLVVQMNVQTSEQRSLFHKYRAALKALPSPFLLDVVARPGAYYSVWKPPTGQPLSEFLAQNRKNAEAGQAVREFASQLEAAGFALEDADVYLQGGKPVLAGLVPVERSSEDVARLNLEALAPLSGTARPRAARALRPKAARAPKPAPTSKTARSRWLGFLRFFLSTVPGVALLAGAGYWGARALDVYFNPPVLSVPKVVGLDGREAALKVQGSGFRVSLVDGEERDVRIGSVIGQDPVPDSALHGGRLVTLTVNNPRPLSVPKVSELSLEAARTALKDAGFQVGNLRYSYTADLALPKGEVVGQSPETGTQAARGSKVDLLISLGVRPQQTFLPDLTGLSFDDAKALIKQSGLVLTQVTPQDSDKPEGTVLAQTPAPFAKLRVGMPAKLIVARLPQAAPPPRENLETLPLGQIVKRDPPPPPPPPEPTPTPNPTVTPTPDGSSTPQTPGTQTPGTQTPGTQTPGTQSPSAPNVGTSTPPTPNTVPPTSRGTEPSSSAPQAPETPTPSTPIPSTPTPSTPETPSTPPASSVPAGEVRALNFVYAFPADLPAGEAELFVRDAGGEQRLLTQENAAGLSVQVDVRVTGPVTFEVKVNGTTYDTFSR